MPGEQSHPHKYSKFRFDSKLVLGCQELEPTSACLSSKLWYKEIISSLPDKLLIKALSLRLQISASVYLRERSGGRISNFENYIIWYSIWITHEDNNTQLLKTVKFFQSGLYGENFEKQNFNVLKSINNLI